MTESKPPVARFAWIRKQTGLKDPANIATYEIANAICAGGALAALMGFVFLQTWTDWRNPGTIMLLIFEVALFIFGSTLSVWGVTALLMKKAATRKPPIPQPEATPK